MNGGKKEAGVARFFHVSTLFAAENKTMSGWQQTQKTC